MMTNSKRTRTGITMKIPPFRRQITGPLLVSLVFLPPKGKKKKKMVERVDWNFEETKGINLNRWGEEVIHIYEFVRDNLSFFFFFVFS